MKIIKNGACDEEKVIASDFMVSRNEFLCVNIDDIEIYLNKLKLMNGLLVVGIFRFRLRNTISMLFKAGLASFPTCHVDLELRC